MLDNSVKVGDWIRYVFNLDLSAEVKLTLGVAYRIADVGFKFDNLRDSKFLASVEVEDDSGRLVWFSPRRFERVITPTIEVLY